MGSGASVVQAASAMMEGATVQQAASLVSHGVNLRIHLHQQQHKTHGTILSMRQ